MSSCKPISTPMPSKGQHLPNCNELYPDPTHYKSIVGGLQYLTFTRPDISYSVNFVCQFMHAPTLAHYKLVKRILRYVCGTCHALNSIPGFVTMTGMLVSSLNLMLTRTNLTFTKLLQMLLSFFSFLFLYLNDLTFHLIFRASTL